MKKSCLLGFLAVLRCAALQSPMSGEEIERSVSFGLAGDASLMRSFAGGSNFADRQSRIVNPNDENVTHTRTAGGSLTVSVAKLRHKVPKEAMNAFIRGEKSSQAGNHEVAALELEAAVARDPEFADAHGGLGLEYAALMRFSDAERELERSIALDPSSTSYYNLGLLYFQMGDMQDAETNVRKALQLPRSEPTTHLLMAYILMPDPTKREEAERHLRYAARTIPQAGYLLNKLLEGQPHS